MASPAHARTLTCKDQNLGLHLPPRTVVSVARNQTRGNRLGRSAIPIKGAER